MGQVDVVILDLAEIPAVIGIDDLLEQVQGIMEGKAYVADLPSGLGLLQLLCQIELFHLFLIAFSA